MVSPRASNHKCFAWKLVANLVQELARCLVIQLFGKLINQGTFCQLESNSKSIPAHWLIAGSALGGYLFSRTRSEQRLFHRTFVNLIFLSCFLEGIVGQDVFTGCLYDLPNWASLAWLPLLIAESESIVSISSSPVYNLVGVLAILTIYKCRNYGEFSPTFVFTLESFM